MDATKDTDGYFRTDKGREQDTGIGNVSTYRAPPFHKPVISAPAPLTPKWFMPAEQLGRSIDTFPKQTGGAGNTIINFTPPMWLSQVNTQNVIVSSATVNGFVPSGIATNIDVHGTNATWAIYLDATVSNTTGAVSAVAVSSSNSNTVPSDSSTHAYRKIWEVVVSGSVITLVTPMLAWSQEFVACTPGTASSYRWVVA